MKIPIFEHHAIKPFARFGFQHPFFDVHIDTLIYTWIAMAFMFGIVIAARFYFRRRKINPFSYALEQLIEFFVNLCKDSFGFFQYNWFAFVTSLFLFTFLCNAVGMLPFVKEPTEDLNTALACGICSFFYVQMQKIRVEGFWHYIKEYFQPIFILFPLNLIGELAKIASMSFRLFGNILGGAIIIMIAFKAIEPYRIPLMIYIGIALPLVLILSRWVDPRKYPRLHQFTIANHLIVFSSAWVFMFFGLFEGAVQAFVITMLTVTYLSLVGKNDVEEEENDEVNAKEPHAVS